MNIDPKQPAQNLLFLHIQKTAGSTLHNIMGRQYPKETIFNIYNTIDDLGKFEKLSAGQKKNIRLVKGHFPFGLHEQLEGSSEYITILRDPVERTISHFYHAAEDKTHFRYEEIRKNNYSLMDVLEKGIMPNLDNNMVRMLSGENRVPFGSCTEAMLDKAMYNLENHFSIIGLQTRFDEFVLESAARFVWEKSLYYRKSRVGKTRPQKNQLDAKTFSAVKSYNQLDQKLFDAWAPVVEKRIAEKGEKFTEELRLFKAKNASRNKYWGWWPESLTP